MTLPFDKKYQTIARRLAVKHRERDRVSMLRPERAAKPATRRVRRYAMVSCAIIGLLLAPVQPACAWSHDGATVTRSPRARLYHAKASDNAGHGTTSSAIDGFRARFTRE